MKTDLDRQLKDWAARHVPQQEHLDGLARTIATEAARNRYLRHQSTVAGGALLWQKLGYGVAGAVLAIAGLVLWSGRSAAPSGEGGSASIAQLVAPSRSQVDAVRKLFAETSRIFPNQLRWIAQSNGDVGMGVESEQGRPIPDTQAMLVRLVMVTRVSGEKNWRRTWSTDVVMRGEDLVEITPSRQWDNKLTLWVYPLENGKVAVDTTIALDKPASLSTRLNSVVGMGEPVEVSNTRRGNEEIKVFQTVEPLASPGRSES